MSTTTRTVRNSSARLPWRQPRCPWWRCRPGPRSSVTAQARGGRKARGRRWCSSVAHRPKAWPRSPFERSVLLFDRDALDDDALFRRAGAAADGIDLGDDVEAAHHLAEERVERRETHPVVAADHEELAAIGVGPCIGHGQRTDLVATRLRQFVREAVPGPAGTR